MNNGLKQIWLDFFNYYLFSAQLGGVNDTDRNGLCYLLMEHTCRHIPSLRDRRLIRNAMRDDLGNRYGDSDYPFGGWAKFHYECDNDEAHLNPERIAYVKSKIQQLTGELNESK